MGRVSRKVAGTVGSLGEWGFLARLLPKLSKGLSGRVALGPGDDAALIRVGRETWALTTDMLVDGVHFRKEWTTGENLGHKTLAVNLSDLAAMGDVEPTVGVLSAGIPPKTPVRFIEGFYRGFARLARRHGFELVGGDTVRSDRMVFSLAAFGRVRGPVFKRSGARVGDALMVTGTLGDAAAGLILLEKGRRRDPFLVRRLLRPEPRLDWARRLAGTGAVTAGMDSSDGFWRSVKILGDSSDVGAEVWADRLPVSPALRTWAKGRAEDFALVGGEDYELVFTARPEAVRRIENLGFARAVGRILPAGRGLTALHDGRKREVPSGFEHFNG
jgi:thiamine-monophosphate kinase